MVKKPIIILIFFILFSIIASLFFITEYYEEILINQEAQKNEVIAQNNINNIKFYLESELEQMDVFLENADKDELDGFTELYANYYDVELQETVGSTKSSAFLSDWQIELGDYMFYLVKPLNDYTFVMKISAQEMYEQYLAEVRLGSRGYTSLKDENGIVVMHIDVDQIGVDTFHERYDSYPEINTEESRDLLYHQYHLDYGSNIVESYWWEDNQSELSLKLISYASEQIAGHKFVTTVVVDVEEVIGPIHSLTMILSVLATVLILFISFIVYSYQIAKRKEQKANHELVLAKYEEQFHAQESQMQRFEQSQAISVFSTSLAHELNNMLTPAMIYCDILRQKNLSQEMSEIVEMITNSIESCKDLTMQLKEVGKHSDIEIFECFDYRDWLITQMEFVRYLIPKRIELRQTITSKDCLIHGNQRALQQVLINLIYNAIQAIEGQGVIEINLTFMEHECIFEIKDTGCGMDASTQQKVFEPFFTTKIKEGTGLGLSVVKTILKKHRGAIRCESKINKGTSFFIKLPVKYE